MFLMRDIYFMKFIIYFISLYERDQKEKWFFLR